VSAAADEGQMTIGQVAERAGVRASAIRYYEDVGVLPTPERVGGQRRYNADVLRRLTIVDVAQRAGFTLEEIGELVGRTSEGGPAFERVRALAERKLPAIEALIERAETVRNWLEHARACDCPTLEVCALFDDAVALPERRSGLSPAQVPALRARAGVAAPR
jgi:DNA-binding transcriptional MerR regulator